MSLSEQTERLLLERRDEFNEVEGEARREFHAIVEQARRRYLDAILAALDQGAQQTEIAEALGVTRGRVWQLGDNHPPAAAR